MSCPIYVKPRLKGVISVDKVRIKLCGAGCSTTVVHEHVDRIP